MPVGTKPRRPLQQTALETGAPLDTLWARGLKSHRRALWSKAAHGTMLALVICWFWLLHSLVPPGSTSLPTGTEVFVASIWTCRGKDLGVRQTKPEQAVWDVSVIISGLGCPQTLNPYSQGVSSLLMEKMSLPCILMSCWAVNAGRLTNCEYCQPVKPDFNHGF